MSGQGTGNTSVGSAGVLRGDDQKTSKGPSAGEDRFHDGKENSHIATDSKDQRSIANRLAAAEKESSSSGDDRKLNERDPTAPAISHGNKPSRGAEIDAELQAEDEAILAKKGDAMPGKKQ